MRPAGLIWAVFALSAGLLGHEIALMRVLLVASWHHFAFLVISIALLGYGAGGTALCWLRRPLLPRAEAVVFWLVLATAVAMPASLQLAQQVPVEARFVPALLGRQVFAWVLYWGLLCLPFLLGATAIGLALMAAGKRLPTVYAASLAGSALGAILALLAMRLVAPAWLAPVMGMLALAGTLPRPRLWIGRRALGRSGRRTLSRMRRRSLRRLAVVAACALAVGIWLAASPPRIRVDPFKYSSYLDRICAQGEATRIARAHGPRALVEAYAGDVFHELAFLSLGAAPPPLIALAADGHWTGSLLRVGGAEEASAVDATLMSLPYALLAPRPRVLLLGESGGANIWLAERHDAALVQVVQPNRELLALMRGPLAERGGQVFARPAVAIAETEPRHFVERDSTRYDLVQLALLESWAMESGGVGGLRQDHLVTVEGLAACLSRLAPEGILAVCRGIQAPPRDNVKLLATLIASLRRLGVERPELHIAVLRDYLAACTMVKAAPWSAAEIDALRELCASRELTPVYFPGIRPDELNRPDHLPGPPEASGDWLHHAALALLSGAAGDFIARWPFDVRPPTDDRPFFANFSKPGAAGRLREVFGELWLTRAELSLSFVLAAAGLVGLAGALLTVLPLLLLREIRRARGRAKSAAYFVAIGLAYLILEIALLSKLTRIFGDPVQAGAVTIAGLLLFSGLGSRAAQGLGGLWRGAPRILLLALVLLGAVETCLMGKLVSLAAPLSVGGRFLLAGLLIGPLGFLMGFPMPSGLARLERGAPALIPWAWGLNGFASVLAPPLATAIGMCWGFRAAAAVALLLYLLAALLYSGLPARARHGV